MYGGAAAATSALPIDVLFDMLLYIVSRVSMYQNIELSIYRNFDISITEYGGAATANSAPTLHMTTVGYRIEGFDV